MVLDACSQNMNRCACLLCPYLAPNVVVVEPGVAIAGDLGNMLAGLLHTYSVVVVWGLGFECMGKGIVVGTVV